MIPRETIINAIVFDNCKNSPMFIDAFKEVVNTWDNFLLAEIMHKKTGRFFYPKTSTQFIEL